MTAVAEEKKYSVLIATVLVAEDEEMMRRVLVTMLKNNGYRPLEAEDGQVALDTALREHPDVVVLDILMPKIDGLTVLQRLRQDPWGKTVPVILLSNVDPDKEVLAKMQSHNASYYLVKAKTSLEDILEKIENLLRIATEGAETGTYGML